MNARTTFVSAALERGWVLFPLAHNSKQPPEGTSGHLAWTVLDSRDFVDELNNEHNNIGLVTGASSGLFVVDVDPKHGGSVDAVRQLCGGALPKTRTFRTQSGGLHILFNHPGFAVANSVGKLAPGIDVRGDGGYIVAPTSAIDGRTYEVEDGAEITNAPSALLDKVQRIERPASDVTPEPGKLTETEREMFRRWLNESVQSVSEKHGERHDNLFREALNAFRCAAWTGDDWDEVQAALEEAYKVSGGEDLRDVTKVMRDARIAAETTPKDYTPACDRVPDTFTGNAAQLLDDVVALLRRFIYLEDERWYHVLALYAALTHMLRYSESIDIAPRLGFLSSTPGSGKSIAQERMMQLCKGELMTDPSPAAILRLQQGMIANETAPALPIPLSLDEIDNLYASKQQDTGSTTAILNTGYRRGAKVIRADQNDQQKAIAYECFGPIVFGGLAKARIPEALLSRSFLVQMVKASPEENPEGYRRRKHGQLFDDAATALESWSYTAMQDDDNVNDILDDAEEWLSVFVSGRDLELWGALAVPAILAGDVWEKRLQDACEAFKDAAKTDYETPGVLFLRATRKLYHNPLSLQDVGDVNDRNVSGAYLARGVPTFEESFSKWGKDGFDASHVRDLLKEFGVRVAPVRIGTKTPRGYKWSDFYPLWERYLGGIDDDEVIVE
ncbi:bifunctional DNA primase/polymerase [Amycolatopsis sp. Poz14]|uniref:bifunctional DNA primase/polymerase n=1 Tax=Amycolatopsis sp. Poz14 TaxID=1447705 RepID=UPI001EE852AE|nr:bifunctional DNA primase/polymerase [Amycolatopsis sp. Poz14]MCG3754675.1 bifunctional DNA primase/polymerase [Amycolatopsis sp. Poz14]